MNKEEALQKSDELIAQLEGTGWEPHVYYKRMEWYPGARTGSHGNGFLTVAYHEKDGDSWYTSSLTGFKNSVGVQEIWNSDKWVYDDPNEAVQVRLGQARSIMEPLRDLLTNIEDSVPTWKLPPIESAYRVYAMQASLYSRNILERDKTFFTVVVGNDFQLMGSSLTEAIRQGLDVFDKLKEAVSKEPNSKKKRALGAKLFAGWLRPRARVMKALQVLEDRGCPLEIKKLFVITCLDAQTYLATI